jgi:hypothetical protein
MGGGSGRWGMGLLFQRNRGNNLCQIFTERGVLIFASEYKLKNLDRPAVAQELRYRYVDGTTILLKGGLALVPVSQRGTQSLHPELLRSLLFTGKEPDARVASITSGRGTSLGPMGGLPGPASDAQRPTGSRSPELAVEARFVWRATEPVQLHLTSRHPARVDGSRTLRCFSQDGCSARKRGAGLMGARGLHKLGTEGDAPALFDTEA